MKSEKWDVRPEEVDLSVNIGGLQCKNPVWVASGCYNYGREYAHLYSLSALGALCTKGTSSVPWEGNPGTRIAETPAGMLNAIGLQNPGVEHYISVEAPFLRQQGATVVLNIVGRTIDEYVEVAARANPENADALELNISCPNVKQGGLAFSTSVKATYEVTAAVRKATRLPLFVKVSPNVTNVVDFAKAIEEAGADAVTVANALLGMAIDVRLKKPVITNLFGGLSGPAVKPVILRMVWQIASAVKIPVVGIGGVTTPTDAIEYFMAGAAAVQIGSACFANPMAPIEVTAGLRQYMAEQGFRRIADLQGIARPKGAAALGNLPQIGESPGTSVPLGAGTGTPLPPGTGVPPRVKRPD